jgi:hypothetical protein
MLELNINCREITKEDLELDVDLNNPKNYEFRLYLKNSKAVSRIKKVFIDNFGFENIDLAKDIFGNGKDKVIKKLQKKFSLKNNRNDNDALPSSAPLFQSNEESNEDNSYSLNNNLNCHPKMNALINSALSSSDELANAGDPLNNSYSLDNNTNNIDNPGFRSLTSFARNDNTALTSSSEDDSLLSSSDGTQCNAGDPPNNSYSLNNNLNCHPGLDPRSTSENNKYFEFKKISDDQLQYYDIKNYNINNYDNNNKSLTKKELYELKKKLKKEKNNAIINKIVDPPPTLNGR